MSRMKHFQLRTVRGLTVLGLVLLLALLPIKSALGQARVLFMDDIQPASAPSLGQQPFPIDRELNFTPSQTNTTQLNQLFQFETTPDICAAGEGYVTVDFNYLKYPGTLKQYRYQLQGQYGITDQIAIGGFVPGITNSDIGSRSGLGDIGLYGQYKLDQIINPEILNVTAQLDVLLPTGSNSQMRDTGKFGVRPLILAYKDFGQHGPGTIGLYGLFGFTVTTNSDLRVGVAATYQVADMVGIIEFFEQTGVRFRKPLVQVTPGFSFRGLNPWEFTVGVPVGVNSGAPDWGIICKVTYAFAN